MSQLQAISSGGVPGGCRENLFGSPRPLGPRDCPPFFRTPAWKPFSKISGHRGSQMFVLWRGTQFKGAHPWPLGRAFIFSPPSPQSQNVRVEFGGGVVRLVWAFAKPLFHPGFCANFPFWFILVLSGGFFFLSATPSGY